MKIFRIISQDSKVDLNDCVVVAETEERALKLAGISDPDKLVDFEMFEIPTDKEFVDQQGYDTHS